MTERARAYVDTYSAASAASAATTTKIDNLRDRIEKLRDRIEKLEKRLNAVQYPSWIDCLVRPLAAEVQAAIGASGNEVLGPAGIGAQVYVYFAMPDGTSRHISFEPGDLGKGELLVHTGRVLDRYAPGTVGYVNELNLGTVPVPDDLAAILPYVTEAR